MTWQMGLKDAVERLMEHTPGHEHPRFDARDREALAFVLAEIGRLREENRTLHAELYVSLEGHD